MKNVLIIANLYGSKRVVGLCNYLPEFGWQPTVITPRISWQPTIITPIPRVLPNLPFDVMETDYKDIGGLLRKILRINTIGEPRAWAKSLIKNNAWGYVVDRIFNLGGMIINYPDQYKGWAEFAWRESVSTLITHHCDAIISICPPTAHIVASRLKKVSGLFWLADFPDLWSKNASYAYGKARQCVDTKLELQTMRNVDVITSTSQPWADIQKKLHNKSTYSITLGYNTEDYKCKVKITSKFTITYTGLIYAGQSPEKLFVAISELLNSKQINREDIEVDFYGLIVGWVDDKIKQYQLSDVVYQHGLVSHEISVQKQMESQILLVLDIESKNEVGTYTGKIFEYLGAHRPILVVDGIHGNVIEGLLNETHAGFHATTIEEIKVALLSYYKEYKEKGEVLYKGIESEVVKHSNRGMAKQFAELLDKGTNK